ncbi:MAG: hypothetical protein QMD10_11725, partial [Desulfitobacteriaceae bacterium]|nr:hypothetical protein [Desulfitobacteriaceae bacterium]
MRLKPFIAMGILICCLVIAGIIALSSNDKILLPWGENDLELGFSEEGMRGGPTGFCPVGNNT